MPGTIPGSSILEFYNDANIFITGGTGFIGKVLLEKFLRVCHNVNHIYILVRMKKGKDPVSRLKELFSDPLFQRLQKERPDFEKKITCIPGDVGAKRLNMSDNDYEFLVNEVTHVFHSAATVRFNETLTTAVNINVLGTQEMLTFCKKCIRLKVFVHISTAYSNCVRNVICEEYYDPPMTGDNVMNLIKALSDDQINSITGALIKPWPNTYSFSKAIAESVVMECGRTIPALVFRPGIVMGAYEEPLEGWIDNIYGPTGVITAVGLGLMRVLLADRNSKANVLPVDLTVNAIISSAWEVGTNFANNSPAENSLKESKESAGLTRKATATPKIYNFVADENNSISWGEFLKINLKWGLRSPSTRTIWYYSITLTKIKVLFLLLTLLLHFVPAVLGDGICILLGKKPQLWKGYQKIYEFSKIMSIFSTTHWRFSNQNVQELRSRLSDADKELFNFDMATLEWDKYLSRVIIGIRRYILREGEETLPAARRKLFMLWLGHRVLQCSFVIFSLWILSKFIFVHDSLKIPFKEFNLVHPGLLGNST